MISSLKFTITSFLLLTTLFCYAAKVPKKMKHNCRMKIMKPCKEKKQKLKKLKVPSLKTFSQNAEMK